MAAQQPSSYSPGFMNNPSQLQITNMAMNMQSQYPQDPAALQRAQQNPMYSSYPYMINNPMRRWSQVCVKIEDAYDDDF